MRSSRALLSFPSSSGSSLVSSRASSNASLVHQREHGDDLESYLTLVAGEGKKMGKGAKRGSAVIDWGRLLDGQCEETQKQEEVETEKSGEYGDIEQFLKPKSASLPKKSSEKKSPVPETAEKDAPGPSGLPDEPSATTLMALPRLLPHAVDTDLSYSIPMSDSLSDSMSEPRLATRDKDRMPNSTEKLQGNTKTRELSNQALGTHYRHIARDGQTSAVTKSHGRVSFTASEGDTTSDDELSVSQDLGLSSHFRNNIFTLDQLEPLVDSNQYQTAVAHSTDSAASEDSPPGDIHQLHNIVSVADLNSFPAESQTKLPQIVKAPSHGQEEQDSAQERSSSEEKQSGDLNSTCEEIMKSDDDTEISLAYEEDFEDETVAGSEASSLRDSLDSSGVESEVESEVESVVSFSHRDRERSCEHSSGGDKQGSEESVAISHSAIGREESEERSMGHSAEESGERERDYYSAQTQSSVGGTVPGASVGSGAVATTSGQQVAEVGTATPSSRAKGPGDRHRDSTEQNLKGIY